MTNSVDFSTIPVLWGVPQGYEAFLLAQRSKEKKTPILYIARDEAHLVDVQNVLSYIDPYLKILTFPAWDCLPYDRTSPSASVTASRVKTLSYLANIQQSESCVVLTTVGSVLQKIPPRCVFEGQFLHLKVGDDIDLPSLSQLLADSGYLRTDTVLESGEFAIRGGILDFFPSSEDKPIRLDLFGDEIENIRIFDPISQRSEKPLKEIVISPASELVFDQHSIDLFKKSWVHYFGEISTKDELYQRISDGLNVPGMEHWLPFFFPKMETIFDYLKKGGVFLDYQVEESMSARLELINDYYQARRQPIREEGEPYRPLPVHLLYLTDEELLKHFSSIPTLSFNPFIKPDSAKGIDMGVRPGKLFAKNLDGVQREEVFSIVGEQAQTWHQQNCRTFVTAYTNGSRERIATLFNEHKIATQKFATWHEAKTYKGAASIGLLILSLPRGFKGRDYAFISEEDLLGERIGRPRKQRARSAKNLIQQASELSIGDLIVHQDYGIGRYAGLKTLDVGAAPHDCLELLYHGAEKLYLPVENIELLSRFGSDQAVVSLDRLGSASWQFRKGKMKNRIRDIANDLVQTAAKRQLQEAPEIVPQSGVWEEFCSQFPYVETEDQLNAVNDILKDLASGHPMDRLICGDVGFGKTEVALRAAFAVAMNGGQVALIVPTTLLARQHYKTFKKRFEGFPVHVRWLSRLVTTREANQTRKMLADGTANIVIGTHALLSKKVQFSNLELLIIDEEQHFGVTHKEKLKALRDDVHVLTLTATPLPRTLQLSLSGVRDMSLIATPPTDRLAIHTFITPFDRVILHEAIQRERFRGGQIFCVAPRINDLDTLYKRLSSIVPDARCVRAHGQLPAKELEQVMSDFSNGKYDILLSTNIVESGLDMPAVNTLIVHKADMFGLGQLYQLRGRVGRGRQRGYAYLTWPQGHVLADSSQKRLEIMQTLDTLGAGFTLASHDLDMRGAGNILGDEQSGHVREIGVELYQNMLEEAVMSLRSQHQEIENQKWTPQILLGLPVLIPDSYVKDLPVRLGLYRRINQLESHQEIESMMVELVDRFGPLPQEAKNLLDIIEMKQLCLEAGVSRIEAGPKGMAVQFHTKSFVNPDGLLKWVADYEGDDIKLRPDHKLIFLGQFDPQIRFRKARDILNELIKLEVTHAQTS